ncbi:discoidin domain-containing protein [Myxococcus sp. SDU36]|uniref:PKD domain-containing protein n=1 Tax=Myxococcus sp. SDU36 TaxID=2831967 RepID=UPI002542F2BC|nr:discoidin domain-containing protein [Myxococcus sp. SDU36]WIG98749.1 discoidin domain-containing protein [Myxococcus sp. SDU36]
MRWSLRTLTEALCFLSLSLAVPAQAQATNVALGKPSSASSIHAIGYPTQFGPEKAFNGIINTSDRWSSAVSPLPSNPEWIEVDLQAVHGVQSITLYVSRDSNYGRMVDFDVMSRTSNTASHQVVPGGAITGNTENVRTLTFAQPVNARYVRLQCKLAMNDNLCRVREIQVFGSVLSNQPPWVFAGNETTIALPASSVPLQGSASDGDGTVTHYLWDQVSGPSPATLTGATSPSATASNLVAGVYVFRLTATDNQGATGSDIVRVIVHPESAPPDPRAGKLHVWNRGGRYDTAVFLPKDYGTRPGKKYPLVLSLHGRGGSTLNGDHTQVGANPEGFIRQLTPGKPLVDTFPGVVIAPNGPRVGAPLDTWWQVDATHTLVQQALSEYEIDPDRVTMTGLSSGGSGVNDQMKKYRSTYAGGMPIAYFPPTPADVCELDDFPMWASGNADDGTFSVHRWTNATTGFQTLLRQCPGYSGEFLLTVNPSGGHSGWDSFWSRSDAQNWLVSQQRKAP